MTELEINEYRDYKRFAQDWANDDVAARQVWQLLGQLEDNELLIQLPDWLAEQKVEFVDEQCPQRSSDESIVKQTMRSDLVMQRPFHRF